MIFKIQDTRVPVIRIEVCSRHYVHVCEKKTQSKDEGLLGIKNAHSVSVVENDDKGKGHESGRESHMISENKNCQREERLKMITHYRGDPS